MKITFVIPNDRLAGGTRVVSIYAEHLQRHGHTISIISAPLPRLPLRQRLKTFLQPKQNATPTPDVLNLKDLNIHHHCIDRYRPLRDSDLPDADVVIATWWETAEWVAPLSRAKGIKVYFVQHHEVFDYLPKERVQATYHLPFFHITIAQWLVDILRDRYQSKSVALVPNGVDLDQFDSLPRVKRAVPSVGLVYATTTWKGCDIALESFTQAQRQIPDLRLVAFGMEQPTKTLPLPDGTDYCFHPPQATLKDWYAQCDAWLFSSRLEGFGLPILEAMACRTPVIATPAGAAPELLRNGGGILLHDYAVPSMAQAIQRICTLDRDQWQQLSNKAYQTAFQRSWENATHQFEAALHEAIALETPHR
jgi:glycosyltransferase involved in cell wall biosynthesis